jgi:hypothetical protein
MTEIEKTEGEIKVLQAKLELLKEMENHKSPVEEAYKRWMGEYPSTAPSVDSTDDIRWRAFQMGYNASKNNSEDISRVLIEGDDAYIMGVKYQRVEEPSKPMNEVMDRLENKYKDAEENAASYMTDEVIDRMVKKYQAQKLWNIMKDKLGFTMETCDAIVSTVEEWLPKEQSAAGSQNVDTELLVDGHNHCLNKMKEMLR